MFINTEKARVLFEVMKEEVAYEPREVQKRLLLVMASYNGLVPVILNTICSVDYILDMV